MLVHRDPADATSIADPALRALVQKTVADLSEDYPYDPDELGYFVIVEPGDRLETINAQIGFDILANRWDGITFGQPGFSPSFELIDEHAGYYEVVFVMDDSGYGIEVFVPKAAGIDPDLLAMCAKYATPATTNEPAP